MPPEHAQAFPLGRPGLLPDDPDDLENEDEEEDLDDDLDDDWEEDDEEEEGWQVAGVRYRHRPGARSVD